MAKELFWELLVILCLLPYVVGSVWLVQALPTPFVWAALTVLTLFQLTVAGLGCRHIRRSGDSSLMLLVWTLCEYLFLTFIGLLTALTGGGIQLEYVGYIVALALINGVSLTFMIRFIVQMRQWNSPVARHMRTELAAKIVNYFPAAMTRASSDYIRFFCDRCGRETAPADLIPCDGLGGGDALICPLCRPEPADASSDPGVVTVPSRIKV